MKLTGGMHLLSITTSQSTKFKEMNTDNCDKISHSTTIAVAKDFYEGYIITVTVEENLDEDRLGEVFVAGHIFSNKIVCYYIDKEKQDLYCELEYFLDQKAIFLHTTRMTITRYTAGCI